MENLKEIIYSTLILNGKPQQHHCKHCGATHGGLYSAYVCANCWKKGLR